MRRVDFPILFGVLFLLAVTVATSVIGRWFILSQAMLTAMRTGDSRSVARFINSWPSPDNVRDERGMRPLEWAATTGDVEVLRCLLDRGVDPSARIADGPLLYVTVESGHLAAARFLIERGARLDDIVTVSEWSDMTALGVATQKCRRDIVDTLLAAGARAEPDVRLHDRPLRIALGQAAWKSEAQEAKECLDIADDLLAHRADLDLKQKETGETLLHEFAAWRKPMGIYGWGPSKTTEGSRAVVDWLLRHGASPSARDRSGRMPLHACAQSDDAWMPEMLLRYGADVRAKDSSGRTPLHSAAAADSEEIVSFLLRHGAPVDPRDDIAQTPLHAAAGGENAARVLVLWGADIAARDSVGRTPLHLFAAAGRVEGVRMLLMHRADPNARDASGKTPLALALDYSADLDLTDRDPLCQNFAATLDLLRSFGARE